MTKFARFHGTQSLKILGFAGFLSVSVLLNMGLTACALDLPGGRGIGNLGGSGDPGIRMTGGKNGPGGQHLPKIQNMQPGIVSPGALIAQPGNLSGPGNGRIGSPLDPGLSLFKNGPDSTFGPNIGIDSAGIVNFGDTSVDPEIPISDFRQPGPAGDQVGGGGDENIRKANGHGEEIGGSGGEGIRRGKFQPDGIGGGGDENIRKANGHGEEIGGTGEEGIRRGKLQPEGMGGHGESEYHHGTSTLRELNGRELNGENHANGKVSMQDFHFTNVTPGNAPLPNGKVSMQDFHFVMKTSPAGDVDGDGRTDIGSFTPQGPTPPLAGDVDGDGRTDMGGFAPQGPTPPLAGDVDGDGRPDIR